jgi:type IV pilus assembly protein PilC
MTSFSYRAVHKTGRVQKGLMAAANENELASVLRGLDLELIEVQQQKQSLTIRLPERIDPRQKTALCAQLRDLLGAGLPFADALDLVIEAMPVDGLQTKLETMAQTLRAGASVHETFAQHKTVFDPVFLAILDSGERSGDLTTAFASLADQMRRRARLQASLRKALRYPLFLAFVAAGVTSFMMAFVVPEIVLFLTGLGTDLPFATRLLIASADIFASLWWSLPLFISSLLVVLFVGCKTSTSFKESSDGFFSAFASPWPRHKKIGVGAFCLEPRRAFGQRSFYAIVA